MKMILMMVMMMMMMTTVVVMMIFMMLMMIMIFIVFITWPVFEWSLRFAWEATERFPREEENSIPPGPNASTLLDMRRR